MYHWAKINDGRRSHNTAARGPNFSCGAQFVGLLTEESTRLSFAEEGTADVTLQGSTICGVSPDSVSEDPELDPFARVAGS